MNSAEMQTVQDLALRLVDTLKEKELLEKRFRGAQAFVSSVLLPNGGKLMKGNNEMTFNQATMREAVQMYLDSIMVKPCLEVVKVWKKNDEEFSISVSERPEEAKDGEV